MGSKHQQVRHYIESLPIGSQISVRSLAKTLSVSEGTAYRAIKTAEDDGFVSTIERVGSIRIENKSQFIPDMLTYAEIVKIIDGTVVGGENGLEKHLNKFIIGAMTEEAILKYLNPNSLLIVGNRELVQELALNQGVAVLITGGFKASAAIIKLANERQLPVISTNYDTFTVATMINRSMINQEIKQEIMTVEDIYLPLEKTYTLSPQDTITQFNALTKESGLSRFPVHHHGRLTGVVTAKDVIGKGPDTVIERVMTKRVVTVQLHMSVASASHKMTWEDIEMLPVVNDKHELLGVISRQQVMKALQAQHQQSQLVNTFEDDIVMQLKEYPRQHPKNYNYHTFIQPQMLNNLGTLSFGVLSEMIIYVASQYVLDQTGSNHIIEKFDLNYFYLLQLSNEIQFEVNIFHRTRRQALIEVNVFHENSLAAKAILTCQSLEKS